MVRQSTRGTTSHSLKRLHVPFLTFMITKLKVGRTKLYAFKRKQIALLSNLIWTHLTTYRDYKQQCHDRHWWVCRTPRLTSNCSHVPIIPDQFSNIKCNVKQIRVMPFQGHKLVPNQLPISSDYLENRPTASAGMRSIPATVPALETEFLQMSSLHLNNWSWCANFWDFMALS